MTDEMRALCMGVHVLDVLVRRDDVQTSASVLPIRPSGEHPAFHVGRDRSYFADS